MTDMMLIVRIPNATPSEEKILERAFDRLERVFEERDTSYRACCSDTKSVIEALPILTRHETGKGEPELSTEMPQ